MGPTAVGVDSPFACIPTIQRHNLFRFFKVHDQDKSVNKKGQKARRSRQVVGGANTIASEDSAVCSEEFLLGTSISVYQNSGSPSPTNWGEFEKKKTFFGRYAGACAEYLFTCTGGQTPSQHDDRMTCVHVFPCLWAAHHRADWEVVL